MYSGEITKPAVEYIIKTLLGRLYSQLEKTGIRLSRYFPV